MKKTTSSFGVDYFLPLPLIGKLRSFLLSILMYHFSVSPSTMTVAVFRLGGVFFLRPIGLCIYINVT